MTFQTPQNDQANRYKNSSEELSDEICSIWLRIVYIFQTFYIIICGICHDRN
jgi:hypothetical protein